MEPQEAQTPMPAPPVSPAAQQVPRRHRLARQIATMGLVVGVLTILGFNLVYAGKVYPGVSVAGVYLGGLGRQAAIDAVNERIDEYGLGTIGITYEDTTLRIPPLQLGLKYDVETAVDQALQQGRQGSWADQLYAELRAIAGRPTAIAHYTYEDSKLTPYLAELEADLVSPVSDAQLNISGSSVTVTPGVAGRRLNRGALVLAIKDRVARTDSTLIAAPVSQVQPNIDTASLDAVKDQASRFVSAPLELTASGKTYVVPLAEILTWLSLERPLPRQFEQTLDIADFMPAQSPVTLSLSDAKINTYIATLATKTDRPAVNAMLNIQDGHAVVFRPSQSGLALDQKDALEAIKAGLDKQGAERKLALKVATKKPDIAEEDLNNLGIKELISEGVSYFPGSSADRITNVRVGASRFNGVLIKAGETFSFNTILGDVGPETGYVAESVIIDNHIEKQYGGGLCQVSSTAFRAALNAGLPITARQNHSYAVSYYTAPYGVPGVDATIYLPNPDFKFVNDTGYAILIQTTLNVSARSLKFDFYGTKTKSGQVRGPYFVTGSLDATKPSHTVFYRDVLDLAGNVVKTNTFNSYYKSSDDFPKIPNQFNN